MNRIERVVDVEVSVRLAALGQREEALAEHDDRLKAILVVMRSDPDPAVQDTPP
jgi:hypothetical protein